MVADAYDASSSFETHQEVSSSRGAGRGGRRLRGALALALLEQPTLHLVVADEHARLRVFAFNKSAMSPRAADPPAPRHLRRLLHPKLLPSTCRGLRRRHRRGGASLRIAFAVDGTVASSRRSTRAFRRASFLGTRTPTGAPQPAGSTRRRSARTCARPAAARELKGVVDGALLRQYALLDASAQEKLALQIGATRSALLDDLRALDDIGRRVLSLLT